MDIFKRVEMLLFTYVTNNGHYPKQVVMGIDEIYEARESIKSLSRMGMKIKNTEEYEETIFGIPLLRVDKKSYLAVGDLMHE